mmetsp:Transcript_31850/g.82503  ORF Transcript_31850/g.82503 Transcript_31850/m.82503 type:complete len:209 (-) Transcript_31850:740-1366(-)
MSPAMPPGTVSSTGTPLATGSGQVPGATHPDCRSAATLSTSRTGKESASDQPLRWGLMVLHTVMAIGRCALALVQPWVGQRVQLPSCSATVSDLGKQCEAACTPAPSRARVDGPGRRQERRHDSCWKPPTTRPTTAATRCVAQRRTAAPGGWSPAWHEFANLPAPSPSSPPGSSTSSRSSEPLSTPGPAARPPFSTPLPASEHRAVLP